MKAVYIERHGGPEQLKYGDLPEPAAAPAELVVDIVAALLKDRARIAEWRQACQVVEGRASDASIVSVVAALPDDLETFTGRRAELSRLRRAVGESGGTVVISALKHTGEPVPRYPGLPVHRHTGSPAHRGFAARDGRFAIRRIGDGVAAVAALAAQQRAQ